jgi:hypothetical protein
MAGELKGRQVEIDGKAGSADPSLPAFIARPDGALVYHGFRILDEVEVDGFRLGMISGFGGKWSSDDGLEGDAFVVAPDNSRCGLVWEVSDRVYFELVCIPDVARWGVWGVSFALPMSTAENARRNLAAVLPELKTHWRAWLITEAKAKCGDSSLRSE